MSITYVPARMGYRDALVSLLESFQLATKDLPADLEGIVLALDNGMLIGSAGMEKIGRYGLLRSVAVHNEYQKTGIGKQLFDKALEMAREDYIQEVWLLTTTADRYFERQGFERVERAKAPPEIQAIPQFTTLCAATAVVMRKRI